MNIQTILVPSLSLFLMSTLLPSLHAEPKDIKTLSQSVSGSLYIQTTAGPLNDSTPLNPMNLAALQETGVVLKGTFDWTLRWRDYLFIQVRPVFDWQILKGSLSELQEGGAFQGYEDSRLRLERLEFRLSLDAPAAFSWLYSDIVFGRLYPHIGIATIDPLSVLMDGRNGDDFENPWLAGFILYTGPLSFEAWCETEEDPQAFGIAQALLDRHELGVLWAYDKAHRAGLWYRTALTDSLMASFEYLIREDDPFIPLRTTDEAFSWHSTILASLAWTPASGNTGLWLEYRFRQNGLDSKDIGSLYSINIPESLASFALFPWLRSPVHSAGLHIRNTLPIADKWHLQGTIFWLGSTGFHASALAAFLPERRLSLELEASLPFHIGNHTWHSEAELWPYGFRMSLRARWDITTQE